MQYKILSITEKVPKETTLPDGNYIGSWGGYIITVNFDGKTYELTTEQGVKTMNAKVVVNIVDGVATFNTTSN